MPTRIDVDQLSTVTGGTGQPAAIGTGPNAGPNLLHPGWTGSLGDILKKFAEDPTKPR
jgi:hypothetical protein